MKSKILLAACICCSLWAQAKNNYADYVSTLVGTDSNFELSTGNTYPATAMPWGMNFWTPQTGHMGDGWVYNYTANRIRGFKQTHQPSPWMNDYGQFALMPTTGATYSVKTTAPVSSTTRLRRPFPIIIRSI